MRRVATAIGLLVLLLTGSTAAGVLAGAPAAAADDGAASSGPAVWKRYDVKITRGSWQRVAVHTLPEGSTWTVSLQMTLDLNSATGSEIRGQNTSIGWVRLGWGGQSSDGGGDSTGASDNAIAVDNDARYQQLAEHSLSGGGPLAFRVKVGGHGTVNASLLVFKVIKGAPSSSCPQLIPVCAVLGIGAGLVDDASGMVESAAQTMLGVVAKSFLEAYLLMFRYSTTWWLDLSMSPQALAGAVDAGFRGTVMFVAAFVMTLGLISAGIQTAWRRDGSVVGDTAAGLFKAVLVIFGAWSVLGVLWTLSDQLTTALAPSASNIDVDPVLGLGAAASAATGLPVLVIIISAIGFVVSLGMALLMVFRLASAVILALLLPIAAAGAPGTSTRGWLPKVTGWLLALIFLRPTVAAIYRIGFEFMAGGNDSANAALIQQMGQTGDPDSIPAAAADGLMTMLVGMMTLLVATFALPVLLRLFSWMFGSPAGVGGAGLALASIGAQGALMRRSTSAANQSAQLEDALAPRSGPPSPGGGRAAGATSGMPTGPAGSGPTGGSVASNASAGAAGGSAAAGGAGAAAGGAGPAAGGAAAGAAAGPAGMAAGAVIAGGVMQLAGAARSAADQVAKDRDDQ